eukprot:3527029-Pleurochrysis_carterae.AAC.2
MKRMMKFNQQSGAFNAGYAMQRPSVASARLRGKSRANMEAHELVATRTGIGFLFCDPMSALVVDVRYSTSTHASILAAHRELIQVDFLEFGLFGVSAIYQLLRIFVD